MFNIVEYQSNVSQGSATVLQELLESQTIVLLDTVWLDISIVGNITSQRYFEKAQEGQQGSAFLPLQLSPPVN